MEALDEDQKYVTIVYCVSAKDNFSGMFPIVGTRNEDGVLKLRIITNEGNCRNDVLKKQKREESDD